MRLWHDNDGVAVLSFKSKMNSASQAVLSGIRECIAIAEKDFKALVLWQRQGAHFSVGANLQEFVDILETGGDTEAPVAKFQQTSQMLRYASIPTVAAIKGYTFGGGCELAIHCDRVVAAFETYMGLVESGVGLIPAGGGTKEFAKHAMSRAVKGNVMPFIEQYFKQIAMAVVPGSGPDAKQKHYLNPADVIIFNPFELLHVAKHQALAMAESGYQPPRREKIKVAGRAGMANLEMLMVNMKEGGFISDHDHYIGQLVAETICGGDVEPGMLVDEEWLLHLERKAFTTLGQTEKTQARIKHTLETGKPLRN